MSVAYVVARTSERVKDRFCFVSAVGIRAGYLDAMLCHEPCCGDSQCRKGLPSRVWAAIRCGRTRAVRTLDDRIRRLCAQPDGT